MASGTRVPATRITGIHGALLKTMSRRMLGQVPEAAGVVWHYPALLKDAMGFGRKVDSWNRLDRNLASFAAMAAAGAVGCSFCLDLRYFTAHNHGLDEAKARDGRPGGRALRPDPHHGQVTAPPAGIAR